MDPKIIARLRQPFDRSVVKERIGPGGRVLSYVPIACYLERLLDVFQADGFSLEIVRHEIHSEEVLVEVRLQAAGCTKAAIGGAPIARRRDNGQPASLAHSMMAAEAVAVKRACRLFGIGLGLYEDETAEEEADIVPSQGRDVSDRSVASAAATRQPLPPERNRLTAKQLAAIWSLARHEGYDDRTFRQKCTAQFGVQPEFLSKKEASSLIETLGSGRAANSHATRQLAQGG